MNSVVYQNASIAALEVLQVNLVQLEDIQLDLHLAIIVLNRLHCLDCFSVNVVICPIRVSIHKQELSIWFDDELGSNLLFVENPHIVSCEEFSLINLEIEFL